jgi:hypothetical protein
MEDMVNKRFNKQTGRFIISKYSEEFVWDSGKRIRFFYQKLKPMSEIIFIVENSDVVDKGISIT